MSRRRGSAHGERPLTRGGGDPTFKKPHGVSGTLARSSGERGGRDGGVYSTGDLARLTDNTLRTVRHYDELGLLTPLERGEGENRMFGEGQLERLRFISDMRALSFSLASIRDVLACSDGTRAPCDAAAKATAIIDRHLGDVRSKLETLKRLQDTLVRTRETLAHCARCGESWETRHCDRCTVRDPRDMPALVDLLW